jgi:hypothetical protein
MALPCDICKRLIRYKRSRCRALNCGRMVCRDCRWSESKLCDICTGQAVLKELEPNLKQTSDDQIWIYCQGLKVYGKPMNISERLAR